MEVAGTSFVSMTAAANEMVRSRLASMVLQPWGLGAPLALAAVHLGDVCVSVSLPLCLLLSLAVSLSLCLSVSLSLCLSVSLSLCLSVSLSLCLDCLWLSVCVPLYALPSLAPSARQRPFGCPWSPAPRPYWH
jgi:hypothetical protein